MHIFHHKLLPITQKTQLFYKNNGLLNQTVHQKTFPITLQTAFGLSYIENFLGLGTVVVSPRVTAGAIKATAKENLNGAYIPASGDVGTAFGMTSDETGFIMMKHSVKNDNATFETLAMDGVKFYPERLDGIVVSTIKKPSDAQQGSGEQQAGQ